MVEFECITQLSIHVWKESSTSREIGTTVTESPSEGQKEKGFGEVSVSFLFDETQIKNCSTIRKGSSPKIFPGSENQP